MAVLLLLAACVFPTSDGGGKGNGGDNGGDEVDPFTVVESTEQSNRQGTFAVKIDVTEATTSFQVVTAPTRDRFMTATEYLEDPDGNVVLDWEDWYNIPYSLTEAFYPTEFANTLNWPVRAEDGPLKTGTWTFRAATVDGTGAYTSDIDVDVHTMIRTDKDYGQGHLDVVIAYCTGLQDDPEIVRGIEAGAAYWKELYAQWGVSLDVTYATIDVDPDLPATYQGDEAYRTFMEDLGSRGLLMVVGDYIMDNNQIFGEAGGIPGPYYPEPHGAVEVSWATHAGGNGEFSDNEIQVLGETMAHETGHYLGMFHPVEMTYDMWDSIDDTEECTSWNRCDADLGENLMYPYPICTSRSSCAPQDMLSEGQTGVMHRYIGVE